MKIALIQHNPVVGDFSGNSEKILAGAKQAAEKGCTLAIFPEAALCGCPQQGLIARPSFVAAERAMLKALAETLPVTTLLGVISTIKNVDGEVVALQNGKVVPLERKSGTHMSLYCYQNESFGVVIGSDDWDIEQDPSDLTAIVNITASPFVQGGERKRLSALKHICTTRSLPLFFCNQVGGQDQYIFAGGSRVISADGNIVAQAQSFVEDMVIYDTVSGQGDIHTTRYDSEDIEDISQIYDALVLGVRDYVRKSGFSGVVLGLSGGIDSALTATIAADALGAENVMGIAMPSPYSSQGSLEDAEQLAKNLGCRFEIERIDELFATFKDQLAPLFADREEDVSEQNMQARIRGNLLMAISNKFGAMLLNTGNHSELAVGYCTLYGDTCGGLAVLADLSKHLVYALSRYANRDGERIPERTLIKPPSAELKPGQKDVDELPDYDTLDEIIRLYCNEMASVEQIVAAGFKRNIVDDVIRRIRINEYKRRQAPLGLRVISRHTNYGDESQYFMSFPVVNKFVS